MRPDICSECGGKLKTEIEILGKKRIVPCICKCIAEENEREEEERHNRDKQNKLDRFKRFSLMDKNFERSTFENWNFEKCQKIYFDTATRYVEAWEKNRFDNIGFIIHGKPGTGKTYMVSSIANRLMKNGVPVIAISVIGLLQKIRSTFKSDEAEIDIINAMQNAELLILDDMGAENYTDWGREKLYSIIDCRYRMGKPLIITTNLYVNSKELEKDVLARKLRGDDGINRVYDRIIEMCIPIELIGKQNRLESGMSKVEKFKNNVKKEMQKNDYK